MLFFRACVMTNYSKKQMRFFFNINLLTRLWHDISCRLGARKLPALRTSTNQSSQRKRNNHMCYVILHPTSSHLQADGFLARHVMLSEFKRVFFGRFGDLHCAINCISWLLHSPHCWSKTNVAFPKNGWRRTYLNLQISEGVAERRSTSRY